MKKLEYYVSLSAVFSISRTMRHAYEKTYTDDDKIKAGPSICEVSPQAESYPLEYHLDEEKHRKHQVDDFQNKH